LFERRRLLARLTDRPALIDIDGEHIIADSRRNSLRLPRSRSAPKPIFNLKARWPRRIAASAVATQPSGLMPLA
jgi:hypothetical protein